MNAPKPTPTQIKNIVLMETLRNFYQQLMRKNINFIPQSPLWHVPSEMRGILNDQDITIQITYDYELVDGLPGPAYPIFTFYVSSHRIEVYEVILSTANDPSGAVTQTVTRLVDMIFKHYSALLAAYTEVVCNKFASSIVADCLMQAEKREATLELLMPQHQGTINSK